MNKTPSEMTQQELYLEIARLAKENDKLKRTKKFGLVWENKNDAKVEEVRRSAPILVEDSTKRVINDPNDVNHVLINGDNFQAMTALRATHAGKVDVIYIDPPYNTGNKDFIYNDNYLDKEDGYRHSKWLSFMQKRLILARELLSETGVIFVSIDDNEQARLKLLMDDIFGADNFIANVVWQGGRKNNARFVSVGADYFLIYAKRTGALLDASVSWREKKRGINDALSMAQKIWEESDSQQMAQKAWRNWLKRESIRFDDAVSRYSTLDPLSGRPMRPDGNLSAPTGKGPRYDVIHPITGKPTAIPGPGWRWTQERMKSEITAGNVFFGEDEHRIPSGKNYLDQLDSQVLDSVFFKERNPSNRLLTSILGSKVFDFPKDHEVIARWLKYVSASNPNAIVLDFFAGSGTTAHAVAELNKQDGGKRQCILITDGGKTETTGESSKNAGENAVNIAEEITYERVKRVLTGKGWADGKEHEPLGGNLFYLNTVMKYVGTIDAKSKEPYFCPSNSTAFSLDTGVWHPILEEVGEFTEWPFQKRDYKLFALPKGEDGKQNYALTINTSDWEFTAFKEWFDENMPEDSTVFLYADSFSHAGCEWMEELEMVKDPRLAEVNITKRLINNHNWVAHSFLKTDI